MKKLNIFLMMVLALCFTSCEDEWVEAKPLTSEQETVFRGENFVVGNGDLSGEIVLLAENAETVLTVAEFVSADSMPAEATVEFSMQMAKNEDFSDAVDVPVENAGNAATAKTSDLQEAYVKVQGKNPEARKVYVRYTAYVITPEYKVKVRVNGDETYFATTSVTVTPYDPGFRMEPAYYLVWSDDPETLSLNNPDRVWQFEHSEKDVYDDTKFYLIFDIPEAAAGSFYWMVVPQSLKDAGTLEGAYGAEEGFEYELNGPLYTNTNEDYPAIAVCTEETGKYQITVDMYTKVEEEVYANYAITPAFDYMYTPGVSNGWAPGASNMLGTTDYKTYQGMIYLAGEFKFTNAPDWNHTNYGQGGKDGEISATGGNIAGPTGIFWCSLSLPDLTYTLTEITTMGIVGSATPGGWDASTALTLVEEGSIAIKYTGEVTLTDGEIKFRANDAWDVNFGGSLEELTYNAGNIIVTAGTYDILLDMSALPYTCTLTRK